MFLIRAHRDGKIVIIKHRLPNNEGGHERYREMPLVWDREG